MGKGIHEGRCREMNARVRFLERALESLNGKGFECPVCMEDTDPSGKDAGILTCGHAFHEDCLKQMLGANPQCAVCRQPASMQQVTNVARYFKKPTDDDA